MQYILAMYIILLYSTIICHILVLYYYVTGRRSLLSGCPVLLWEVEAGDVRDIDILPGGDVIAARGYYSDGLQVYDKKSGQKIQHPISDMCKIQHPISNMCMIQHPISDMCKGDIEGVSVSDDGAAVAAVESRGYTPGRLHIYTSVNGGWKHQMYNTCYGPESVACTGDEHFYIVGSPKKSMYKYNSRGQQIWEKKLSFWPEFISTDHKNRILASNPYGGYVTVYNEDGVEMFSFPAATDQRKLKPRGLCVDDEDNILVGDGDSKSVLLYDSHGQFLKKLVDVEGNPDSVALYNDSHLAVYADDDSYYNKLRLYGL